MKRIISITIGILMVALLVAGCFQDGGNERGFDSDGVLNLTFFYVNQGGPFQDDYVVFQEATELTNVRLHGTQPRTVTDEEQVFNLMLAGGDFADVITTSRANFDQHGDRVFQPLNDLIEAYAPNINAFFNENPWARQAATSADGNIYFIPRFTDNRAAMGWFIRQDWLDEAGLDIPTNVEEYEAALRAFLEADPNRIPLFNRMPDVRNIFMLYGLRYGWIADDDGVLSYFRHHPQYQVAIENAARWYADGLIDREIFTRGNAARDELFTADLGGSTHDWFVSTARFNDQLQEMVPGFNLVAMAPPADIFGVAVETSSRPRAEAMGWGISVQNEYAAETMAFFDFWFTEEGRMLYNFGIEGVHYDMIDGYPTVRTEFLESGDDMNTTIWGWGGGLIIGAQQDFRFEEQWMHPAAREGMAMYVAGGYIVDPFPPLSFTDEEQRVITDLWSAIFTVMIEQEQRWVLGHDEITNETFAAHMAVIEGMGMNDVVAVHQSAYDRYRAAQQQ